MHSGRIRETLAQAAAEQAGLARGAFAARAALAVARGGGLPDDSPQRQALGEFIRAAGLVRRIGVNLNQAVARLNATGQHSGDLLPYAAESLRRVHRAAEQRFELRRTAPRDRTAGSRPTRAESEKARRQGRSEPPRITLRRAVSTASSGEQEFFARLQQAGVVVGKRSSLGEGPPGARRAMPAQPADRGG